jgi:hypothetical protein
MSPEGANFFFNDNGLANNTGGFTARIEVAMP